MKTLNFQKLLKLRDNSDSIISAAAWKKYSYLVLTKPEYFQFLDQSSPVFFQKLGEEAKELDLPEVWERFFAITDWAIAMECPYLSNLAETLVYLCETAKTEDIGNFEYGDCSYSENSSLQAQSHKRLLQITVHIDISLMRRLMTLASEDVMFFAIVKKCLYALGSSDLWPLNIFPEDFVATDCQDYIDILSYLSDCCNSRSEIFLVKQMLEIFKFEEKQNEISELFINHFRKFTRFLPSLQDSFLNPILEMLSKITVLQGNQTYSLWLKLLKESYLVHEQVLKTLEPLFSKFTIEEQLNFLTICNQHKYSQAVKVSEFYFDLLKKEETSEEFALVLLDSLEASLPKSQVPFWQCIMFLNQYAQGHPQLSEAVMKVIDAQFANLDYTKANMLDFLFLSLQTGDEKMFKLLYSKINLKKLHPQADNFKTAFADMTMNGVDALKKQRFDEVIKEILANCLFDNYQEALKVTELLRQYEIFAEVQLTAEVMEQNELLELIEHF